ncbi:MAG: diguanylate cyclase [Polaromonas sp.]|nr:diguanylate cyclase [Polaromonas sp.]
MTLFSSAKAWLQALKRAIGVSFAVLFLHLLLGSISALAAPLLPVELDTEKQPIALKTWGEYWIDPQALLLPEQIFNKNDLAWEALPARGIYPLKPGQALWIRFTVPRARNQDRWLLDIPYPALDRASLYTFDKTGLWTEQRAGDLTPVNRWSTPHRHPLLVMKYTPDESTQYLLRLENAQGFSAPIRFVSSRYVLRDEQMISLFLGFYFGLAILGSAIGLIGVVWLKDRAYMYYGMCSALVGLTLAAITGVAALHLWPDSGYWADRSLVVVGTWMLISILLLNATVVSLEQRSRALNRLVWLAALGGAALSVALCLTESAIRVKLVIPYVLLVPCLVISINLWAWRHGDRFGGWLLLSSVPFAISWAVATARYLQWIPLSFATEQGGLASIALQLPAMLAVLVLRSQQRRENKRRIQGLDRIDPTTGLINQQVFEERLARMMARSERLKHHSAVMLIDIVNAEHTQRDFGRKIADELPLRVAERLLSTVREIDSAAQLSTRRFGMLVEGPFSASDAASLGPRIVARCLMPYKGLHDECVAQVHVAYALVPCRNPDPKALLARLQERLALARHEDKRAVFVVTEPPLSAEASNRGSLRTNH